MTLFDKAYCVALEVLAVTRSTAQRHLAGRAWPRVSTPGRTIIRDGLDWRIWLVFWTVFVAGCGMAVLVASTGERDPEGLLVIK